MLFGISFSGLLRLHHNIMALTAAAFTGAPRLELKTTLDLFLEAAVSFECAIFGSAGRVQSLCVKETDVKPV